MTDRENKEIHGLAVKNLYKSYTIEKNNYEVNKDINNQYHECEQARSISAGTLRADFSVF